MSNTRSCFSNQAMFSLQEISDRLEIQQLLVDYSTAIDQRRFDDLDRVFTEDAYIDYRARHVSAARRGGLRLSVTMASLGPRGRPNRAAMHLLRSRKRPSRRPRRRELAQGQPDA